MKNYLAKFFKKDYYGDLASYSSKAVSNVLYYECHFDINRHQIT